MEATFWKSSGLHLVDKTERGWLRTTPDFIRAYLTRPEVHPIDTSCASEVALFDALMNDPFQPVAPERLGLLEDQDAAENYSIVLAFRDLLAEAGTLEGAYLKIMREGLAHVPPVFIDQLVHVILAGLLSSATDPMRLRAAELFFREQSVSIQDGRVMLADTEIVELHAQSGGGTIGRLLAETGTPMRQVELDVIDDSNSSIYWERSDRFDTVIDLRFEQPANYALARVIEAWIEHFVGLAVNVQPTARIRDQAWRWHIGLDRDATAILNALYDGEEVPESDIARLLALYRMEVRDPSRIAEDIAGRPIYLAVAASSSNRLRLKPQNLLTNLPLRLQS